jgi:hypothetical protein
MRLMLVMACGLLVCLCQPARAQAYAALDTDSGLSAGPGALLLHGKNAAGSQQNVVIATIDLAGIRRAWAWQVFYSYSSGPTVFGGSADYILAGADDCADGDETWWIGAGPSIIHLEDVFADAAGVNTIGESINEGFNIGAGWRKHDWSLEGRAHYLIQDKIVAVQANVNYRFN